MANIVIDPVIVMTPPDDATKEKVEMWLENLEIWLIEALAAPFLWLHYRPASHLLEANGQFPSFEHLRKLQRKHRLDINIKQIASNIHKFFRDDTLDLEDRLKCLEFAIEAEAGSIIIEPAQFITRLPGYLQDGVHTLLANCCACKHLEHSLGQQLHIATQALANSPGEILVSVGVLYALPDFVCPTDNKIIQTFPLLITPDNLQSLTDIIDLWAKGEDGIRYAIKQQYKRDRLDSITTAPMFRLGPRFIESVNERGLDTDKTILRSIIRAASDVIADRAKDISSYHLHAFRKSETADSPQLTRDSDHAKAWRLMLQKHGAGWRLHYWQIPTSKAYMIELANVCKESEREI